MCLDRWSEVTFIVHSIEVVISFLTPSLHLNSFYLESRNSSSFLTPSVAIRDLFVDLFASSPISVVCSPRNAFRSSIPTNILHPLFIPSLVPL